MESVEAVPAVAAEIDIPSKPGVKRKRSCRSATKRSKKPRKKSKFTAGTNKENSEVQPESKKKSKSNRCLKKAEKQAVATAIDKSELVASVLEHVDKAACTQL